MNEQVESSQIKEKETRPREVVIHFIRHGQTKYEDSDDKEGVLTDLGKEQARSRARKLFEDFDTGDVVSVYSSQRSRTKETAEEILKELENLSKIGDKTLEIRPSFPLTMSKIGVSDEATSEYLNFQNSNKDPILLWLENHNENAEKMINDFQSFLNHLSHFSETLSSTGPNIHIICITHSGPSEVFAGTLLGNQHPGILDFGEEFNIRFTAGETKPAVISFKNQTSQVNL